jgi:hypothetical protein
VNSIPPDIYERVSELALSITNATMADDDALCKSFYQQLLDYSSEQSLAGRSHPFLLETLADYTDDPAQALGFYKQALALSRHMTSDEPTQTILIGIGARLIELGRREQAEAYLRDGRAEAVKRTDTFGIEEADRLLSEARSE